MNYILGDASVQKAERRKPYLAVYCERLVARFVGKNLKQIIVGLGLVTI